MKKHRINVLAVIIFLAYINSFGQQQVNLANELKNKKMEIVNRIISPYPDKAKNNVENRLYKLP